MQSRFDLAVALYGDGRYEAAAAEYRQLVDLRKRVYGNEHPTVADALYSLGLAYRDLGARDSAITAIEEAIEINRVVRTEHLYGAYALLAHGELQLVADSPAEAEASFREGLPILEKAFGERHYLSSFTRGLLGRSLADQGQLRQGRRLLSSAVEGLAGAQHGQRRVKLLPYLVAILEEIGPPDDLARHRADLIALQADQP